MNQKGQGMIEYILLLVITIAMILLAMVNVFKPLQGFMQNYMGTYLACLLSSGELPSIGTENNLKDADPKCNFSIAFGKSNGSWNSGSGNGGSGNGPGGNGSNDPNNPNNNGGNGANGKDKDGKGSAGSGKGDGSGYGSGDGSGSGGNSYAGSRSRRSGFGKSAFLRRSSDGSGSGDGDGMAGDANKRYVNALNRKGDDRFFRSQQQRRTQLDGRYGRGIAISGLTEDEQQKIERKVQSESRVVPKSSEEFSVPPKKSIVKPPPEKEKKKLEEKEQGFTLGNLFKYVMIAVVLLLILVLGGGQAFEMSKTME